MKHSFYTSKIGKPLEFNGDPLVYTKYLGTLDLLPFTPGFYTKGQSLYGVVLQQNEFFATKADFFKRYYVHENLGGWNKVGITHPENPKLIKKGAWLVGYSKTPLLVGDLYGYTLERVIWAKGFYDPRFGLFKVHFQLGEMPTPILGIKSNSFNTELDKLESLIVDGFNSVVDALDKLKGAFNILNVGVPGISPEGVPIGWATPPNSLAFDAKINTAQGMLKTQIAKIQTQAQTIKELRW